MNVPRAARRLAHAPLRPRRVRDESGAVAVEFALILPILVMLLLGVTTTGLAYTDHLSITNARARGDRLGFGDRLQLNGQLLGLMLCRPGSSQVYFNSGVHPEHEPDLRASSVTPTPQRNRSGEGHAHDQGTPAAAAEPRLPTRLPAGTAWSRYGSRSRAQDRPRRLLHPALRHLAASASVSTDGAAGTCTTPDGPRRRRSSAPQRAWRSRDHGRDFHADRSTRCGGNGARLRPRARRPAGQQVGCRLGRHRGAVRH